MIAPCNRCDRESVHIIWSGDNWLLLCDDHARAHFAPLHVYVLMAIEDGGQIEHHGVFRDLATAQHFLETKYPNLLAWEETTYRHAHGGGGRAWRSWTGKHPTLIEEVPYHEDS